MRLLRVFLILLGVLSFASGAAPQTQTVLPNGMTQFVDGNGAPYAGGYLYMYVPFTTTPKATYQDPNGVTPNQNPITLDANGRAVVWGNGEYRQVLQDAFGVVVWDQLTYASPTSASKSVTLDPAAARATARFAATTVFPVPPLPLAMQTTWALAGSMRVARFSTGTRCGA